MLGMQKYRVMIHGQNLLTVVDGVKQRFGFYTNVFVEAVSSADAEACAIHVLNEDNSLADIMLNSENDPLSLRVDEIYEIESFDGHSVPRDAFMLYPANDKQ